MNAHGAHAACPACGHASSGPAAASPKGPHRYDLLELARAAEADSTYDESVKVRVNQQDIHKLVAKRRKAGP